MLFNSRLLPNVTQADRSLFCEVARLLSRAAEAAADMRGTDGFQCHSICRALRIRMPELRLLDGFYLGLRTLPAEKKRGVRRELMTAGHSWLMTPDGAIIDPYPVGCISLNPLLIPTRGIDVAFGADLYCADPAVTSRIACRDVWRRSVVLAGLLCK